MLEKPPRYGSGSRRLQEPAILPGMVRTTVPPTGFICSRKFAIAFPPSTSNPNLRDNQEFDNLAPRFGNTGMTDKSPKESAHAAPAQPGPVTTRVLESPTGRAVQCYGSNAVTITSEPAAPAFMLNFLEHNRQEPLAYSRGPELAFLHGARTAYSLEA
jgi:hypothetical protein